MHDGRWYRAQSVREYEDAYDAHGIRDDDGPPESLRSAIDGATLVASDMARAVASAKRLAPTGHFETTPLLRELRLEPPLWLPLTLPIGVWDTICYWKWSRQLKAGATHPVARRAHDATEWLLARANAGVLAVVTHGAFRHFLAVQLDARGWKATSRRRTHENWSDWSFER